MYVPNDGVTILTCTVTDTMASIIAMSERASSDKDTGSDGGGVLSAIGYEFETTSFSYTSRDVILYALGGKSPTVHMTTSSTIPFQLVPHCLQTINQN